MSIGYNMPPLPKPPIPRRKRVWIVQQEFSGLIIGVASNQQWAKCLASIYKEAGADVDNYLVREFQVTSNSLSIPPSSHP